MEVNSMKMVLAGSTELNTGVGASASVLAEARNITPSRFSLAAREILRDTAVLGFGDLDQTMLLSDYPLSESQKGIIILALILTAEEIA